MLSWRQVTSRSTDNRSLPSWTEVGRQSKKGSPDDGGDDCFAHVKDSPALENCQKGDSVSFDKVWDDRKGKYKAENVSGGSGGGGGGGGGGW